jgi:hypothetical protein
MCAVKETPSVTTRSGSIVVVNREDHVLPLCALHLKHFHGDSLRDLVKSPTSGKEHQVGAGTTFLTSIAFRALHSMFLALADYFHVHLRLHESVVSCRPLRHHHDSFPLPLKSPHLSHHHLLSVCSTTHFLAKAVLSLACYRLRYAPTHNQKQSKKTMCVS